MKIFCLYLIVFCIFSSCRIFTVNVRNNNYDPFLGIDSLIIVYQNEDYKIDEVRVRYSLDSLKVRKPFWDSVLHMGKYIEPDSICSSANYIHIYTFKGGSRKYDLFNDCDTTEISYSYFKRLKSIVFVE